MLAFFIVDDSAGTGVYFCYRRHDVHLLHGLPGHLPGAAFFVASGSQGFAGFTGLKCAWREHHEQTAGQTPPSFMVFGMVELMDRSAIRT
jgi:hypothetical protein